MEILSPLEKFLDPPPNYIVVLESTDLPSLLFLQSLLHVDNFKDLGYRKTT